MFYIFANLLLIITLQIDRDFFFLFLSVLVLAMESELLIAAILISSWVSVGLSDQPTCVAGLSSCLPFLKGDTKPSPQCCINVLNAVEKDLPCLCNVLNNAAFLHQFNVTKEEALALPSKCGHTPVSCPNNGNFSCFRGDFESAPPFFHMGGIYEKKKMLGG